LAAPARPLQFDVSDRLRERGWVVPAYTLAKGNQGTKVLRVVCRWVAAQHPPPSAIGQSVVWPGWGRSLAVARPLARRRRNGIMEQLQRAIIARAAKRRG
jgi:hypothetical protein